MPPAPESLETALQHHRAGRLADADRIYRRLLQANPRQPDVLHLLGVVAHQQGQNDQALYLIQSAIGQQANAAPYHNNLGLVHRALFQYAEARACHEEALRLQPGYASAHANLGYVLRELGQTQRALQHYQQAVALQPTDADAHVGLGKLLQELGRPADALAAHEQALRLQPLAASAHHHRGECLYDLGRLEEAAASFQKTLDLQPDHGEARHDLGQTLADLGRDDEARAVWNQPLITGDAGSRIRAWLSTPSIFQSVAHLRRRRQWLEDGLTLLEQQDLSVQYPLLQINSTNFYVAYHGMDDLALQRRLTRLLAKATPTLEGRAERRKPPDPGAYAPRLASSAPLRIGFVSRFFHGHTIGEVNIGMIRHLSREVCRVVLFTLAGPEGPLARMIRESADEVIPLTPVLDVARQQIADEKLDLIFYTDIGMDPFTYYLAFSRLAPVQVTTWGHPDTTGIPNLDYYLSSVLLEPEEAQRHYSERLVQLQGLPTYYFAPAFFPPAKPRTHFGLRDDDHLYICPQAPFKVHPDYDEMLARILRADPKGRVLMVRGHQHNWTHQLLRRFHRTLPDVAERIQFLPHQGGQDYLHLLNACDALLDTTHFGGGNTTYKALSVGIPIVTLPGEFARGRVTSACYKKMGVLDCIARDADDYVRIALRLGNDPVWRQEMRSRIKSASTVLYEDSAVLRELEQFFRNVRAGDDSEVSQIG